jgi:hemoglobin/transferrin/lactoferrin receptor protein
MPHRRLASLLLVLLGSAASAGAQSPATGRITGDVTDSSGGVLPGAAVLVRHAASGAERHLITDERGRFSMPGAPPGRYIITGAVPGFSSATEILAVASGTESRVTLALAPGTLSEAVTVTATRTEIPTDQSPAPVTVVTRESLERRTLAGIGDLFRALPSTESVNEGTFQVRPRIRGLESNRVLVLVDGQRLNNTRTATAQSGIEINLVDVEDVERVEVVRGGGSVLYGTDALAGTVNIVTRDTPPRQTDGFRVGGGASGYFSGNEDGRRGSVFVEGAGERVAFRVAQSVERFDSYTSGERDGESVEVPNSGFDGLSTHAVVKYFLDDRQTLKATYDGRRATDIGVAGTGGTFTAYFPFSDRDYAGVNYEGQLLTPRLARVSATGYYQRQRRNFTNEINVPAQPPAFPGTFQRSETITEIATIGADLQTNWVLGPRHLLTAGASFFRDRNDDSRYIERLTPDFSRFPPGLRRSEERSTSVPNATFADVGLFAQDEIELGDRVRATLGVRLDRFDIAAEPTPGYALPPVTPTQLDDLGLGGLDQRLDVNRFAVTGDAGLVVRVSPTVSLTGRVGRSFREPNLFERFFTDFGSVGGFVVGNPNLDPETGINVDTGVRWRWRGAALSTTYFNNTYRDLLTTRPALDDEGNPILIPGAPGQDPIPVSQTVNADRARIQGLEIEADWSVGTAVGAITPFAWASFLRGDDLSRDQPLDRITPRTLFGGVRWESTGQRFWGEYGVRSVEGQDRLPDAVLESRGPEGSFVVQDVRGGIRLGSGPDRASIVFAVTNLTNRYYEEPFASAPARGRSAVVTLNVRFF